MIRYLRLSLAIAAMGLVMSLAFWSRVPNPMPIHWDASGHANGFAPRWLGLSLLPALSAVLAVVFALIARFSKKLTERTERALGVTSVATGAFTVAIHAMTIKASLHPQFQLSIGSFMSLMGVLFIVLASLMPRVDPNPYIGVRVPWTMNDEVNWRLTHRFAGWSMGIAGALVIVFALFLSPPLMFWLAFASIMVGSLLPIAYSYLIHVVRRARG
jgi:uncharacterized membrane protein